VVCITVHVQQPPPPGNHTAAGPAGNHTAAGPLGNHTAAGPLGNHTAAGPPGNHTQQPMYCQLGLLHWGCRASREPHTAAHVLPVRAPTLGLRAVREPLRNIPRINFPVRALTLGLQGRQGTTLHQSPYSTWGLISGLPHWGRGTRGNHMSASVLPTHNLSTDAPEAMSR